MRAAPAEADVAGSSPGGAVSRLRPLRGRSRQQGSRQVVSAACFKAAERCRLDLDVRSEASLLGILVFANDRGWNFNIRAAESPDPDDNPSATVWGPGYPASIPETEVMLAAFNRHKDVCGG